MKLHSQQCLHAAADNELASFWVRKTRKPVLCVALIEKEEVTKIRKGNGKEKIEKTKKITFVRGINLEVSMPTGSLC